jgi:hypothetical protein
MAKPSGRRQHHQRRCSGSPVAARAKPRSQEAGQAGRHVGVHRPRFVTGNGQKIGGIEVIGHERPFGAEPSEDIKSRCYGSPGETLDYVWELEGDTFTIWFGERGSPDYYRGTFSDDGDTLTGAWHYPVGGGYEATATRVE